MHIFASRCVSRFLSEAAYLYIAAAAIILREFLSGEQAGVVPVIVQNRNIV